MITVSISKRAGMTATWVKSFDDPSEAATFAESWLPMHVSVTESDRPIDLYDFLQRARSKETAIRPFQNADGSDALCPFCGQPETPIFCDDECLQACETCDRHWHIDADGNVLPADRCPACESDSITFFEDGRRRCGACGHAFFFDGLTYVDPATVECESDGESC
ncbi:MAG: hypothetical protein HY287_07105 [Planctomycetes bacterium]|nr:hypothetical protein [Planctomycetota bacterium]